MDRMWTGSSEGKSIGMLKDLGFNGCQDDNLPQGQLCSFRYSKAARERMFHRHKQHLRLLKNH